MKQKKTAGRLVRAVYYILAGGLISFILFTISRTALLATVAVTIVYGIITVTTAHKEKVTRLLLHWFLIGMCISIAATIYGGR